MSNTTTVTHPDGTVSKRTSKTNIYTHAIQVSPADPQKLAEYLRGAAERADQKAAALRFAAANSRVVIRSRGWSASGMNDLHSHQATLKDTDREIYTWCSADGMTTTYPDPHPAPAVPAPVDAYLRAAAIRSAEGWEANAIKMRAEADAILAADALVGEWTVERWSSRQDLAQKAVRTFAYLAERGHQVRVVPVDLPKVQDPEVPVPKTELVVHLAYSGERTLCDKTVQFRFVTTTLDDVNCPQCLNQASQVESEEDAVDPFEDCVDTCCTEVQGPQDLPGTWDQADLSGGQADAEDQARAEFAKANPDARIQPAVDPVGPAGTWEVTCEAGPACSTWWMGPLDTELGARAAYIAHRAGRHVQVGDIVTIHRGRDLREVLRVDQDTSLAQVVSCDPQDTRDPWWVSLDLLHQAEQKAVPWGQVVRVGGKRYAILLDGETPYLRPLR